MDLSLSSIVSHGDKEFIIVIILVSDDHTHGPRTLGPNHLGDEGTFSSLDESQLALHLVGVLDEAAATGRLRGDEMDTSVTHIPAGSEYRGVGLR